jgi:hypothetical protein
MNAGVRPGTDENRRAARQRWDGQGVYKARDTVLQQPLRSETFVPAAGPRVVAVEVRWMEGSGPS